MSSRQIARTIRLVQALMLLCEATWMIIFFMRPPAGSLLEAMVFYLRLLGGNSRCTFPIGLASFVIDVMSSRQTGITLDPAHIWLFRGILAFLLLWATGALVVVILALTFSWH